MPQPDSHSLFEVFDGVLPSGLHLAAARIPAVKGWYFTPSAWKIDLAHQPSVEAIWNHLQARCEAAVGAPLRVLCQYATGHTPGFAGDLTCGDGYTLLYFPAEQWRRDWDGETVFYNQQGDIARSVLPKPNRAVLFDSAVRRADRAPSPRCPALRVAIVLDLEIVPAFPAPAAPFNLAEIPTPDLSNVQILVLTAPDPALVPVLRKYWIQQILDHLATLYNFPVPTPLVDREFAVLWKNVQPQLDPDLPDHDSIAAEFRAIAERRVRLRLLLAELARRFAISVPSGVPPEEQAQVAEDLALDRLLAGAAVTRRSATPDEIRALSQS